MNRSPLNESQKGRKNTAGMYPSGKGPAYSGNIRCSRFLYSRPIALTQEGRSLVNDVCECVRD